MGLTSGAEPGAESPKVLERALRVLDLFTERRPEWTAAEIGSAVGLPVSTTYRIVRALESRGLLRQAARGPLPPPGVSRPSAAGSERPLPARRGRHSPRSPRGERLRPQRRAPPRARDSRRR